MDDQAQEVLLVRWTGACNEHLRHFLNLCVPVVKDAGTIAPATGFVLDILGLSCHTTGESALLLSRFGRVWDADMLIRSVLEGTAKYAFLCTTDPVEQARRATEYWHILPEFDRLKRHARVAQFHSIIGELGASGAALRELLMTDEAAQRLKTQYPRRERQSLSQKWSFNEIIRVLSREDTDVAAMLANAYGLSSHTIHQDGDGVGMIWERVRRGDDRRELVTIAHAAREVIDLLTFGMYRALITFRLGGKDTGPVMEYWRDQEPFVQELGSAIESWWAVERQYSPVAPAAEQNSATPA